MLDATTPIASKHALCITGLLAAFLLGTFPLEAGELSVGDRKAQELLGRECPTIELWPEGKVPDELKPIDEEVFRESEQKGNDVLRLTNVSVPTITVATPTKVKPNGTAVIVCPGGGYGILAFNKEGTEVVDWLNSIGVTGILLKYRVPRRNEPFEKHHHALQDAQRALGIVRGRADEWGIDPSRIGILGFSAGGHLTVSLSNNHQERIYEPVDEYDRVSCRPDFVVPVYPAYLTEPLDSDDPDPLMKVDQLGPEVSPPAFIAVAANDRFVHCALIYFDELCRAKVPAELHVYPSGGHGIGLRKDGYPLSQWPDRCERWMKDLGLLD